MTATGTHGLDPNQRFGLPGFPTKPHNWVDVYREGDIFAENSDDQSSAVKAAVYEAVMNDWTSNPNAHDAPFELEGGKDWMRGQLTTGSVPAAQVKPAVV